VRLKQQRRWSWRVRINAAEVKAWFFDSRGCEYVRKCEILMKVWTALLVRVDSASAFCLPQFLAYPRLDGP
jgi:hypothetical protein